MNKQQEMFLEAISQSTQEPTEIETGEILIWLYFSDIDTLVDAMGQDYFSEHERTVSLQNECICVDIRDMMRHLHIQEEWVGINYNSKRRKEVLENEKRCV